MKAPPETAGAFEDAFERLLTQWDALLPAYLAAQAETARLRDVLTDLVVGSTLVAGAYRIPLDPPATPGLLLLANATPERLTLGNATPDHLFAAALRRALRTLRFGDRAGRRA